MITNAITNILNPPDFVEMGIDAETDQSHNVLHIFNRNLVDTAFGGVLVFRDKIEENADNVMMPWDNEEIGHAGMATNNANKKTGTYNTNESGRIENGKGYRHVWDFGTDKANGNISCICLTTKDGGSNGYNCTYPNMAMGGIDLNSSNTSSFSDSAYNIVNRYIGTSQINFSYYKIFYVDRLENGNIRLLGKYMEDCGIYEVQIYNPNAISIRTDKPFCNIVSVKKVIELFPAPSVIPGGSTTYYHGSYYYTNNSMVASSIPSDEQQKMQQDWEKNPQWFPYFPYVYNDEIIIVAGVGKKIRHYTFSLTDYKQKSLKIIDTAVNFISLTDFHYERFANETKWFFGVTKYNSNQYIEYTILSGFYFDGQYFMIPKNPLINGDRNTGTNNYHQFEVSDEDGSMTGKTVQLTTSYANTEYVCCGIYIDDVTSTPIISYHSPTNSPKINAAMLRKLTDGYGLYSLALYRGGNNNSGQTGKTQLIKVKGLSLPLYCTQGEPISNSGNYSFNINYSPLKLCLTTINNLSETVRKLEGQTMKITYDIVEEDEV